MDRSKQSHGFIEAMTKLTMRDIFFTALLYELKIETQEDGPIACTNGVYLKYCPDKFDARTMDDRVFILAHEILHVVLFHSTRRGLRDPKIWNIAADFVVNGLLSEDTGFTVPEYALLNQNLYKDMATESVYDLLIKNAKDHGEDGYGDGYPMPGLPEGFDDVKDYDPADNQGKSASDHERDVAISTSQAAEASKAAGKETSTVRRFVANSQVVKQPWYQQLRKYMTSLNSSEFNWARPDFKRSILFGGMICPKMTSESMGKVVIGVDCSGSVTDVQLAAMGGHISDIMSDCRPAEVDVVYFDSTIKGNDVHTGPSYDMVLRSVGGGGTDFHPIVKYAEEAEDCQLLIVFTDMYGPMPDDCQVPSLWVVDNDQEAPYGDTIEADFND